MDSKEVQRPARFFLEGIEASRPLELNQNKDRRVMRLSVRLAVTNLPSSFRDYRKWEALEVYLQIIQGALDKGKTAILLVPEIS